GPYPVQPGGCAFEGRRWRRCDRRGFPGPWQRAWAPPGLGQPGGAAPRQDPRGGVPQGCRQGGLILVFRGAGTRPRPRFSGGRASRVGALGNTPATFGAGPPTCRKQAQTAVTSVVWGARCE